MQFKSKSANNNHLTIKRTFIDSCSAWNKWRQSQCPPHLFTSIFHSYASRRKTPRWKSYQLCGFSYSSLPSSLTWTRIHHARELWNGAKPFLNGIKRLKTFQIHVWLTVWTSFFRSLDLINRYHYLMFSANKLWNRASGWKRRRLGQMNWSWTEKTNYQLFIFTWRQNFSFLFLPRYAAETTYKD